MNNPPCTPPTPTDLAVERVIERAAQYNSDRPAQHTLLMGGTSKDRRGILDRIVAMLDRDGPGTPPRTGRVPKGPAAGGADALWDRISKAAGLDDDTEGASGLSRIARASSNGLVVAVIDDLDATLAGWSDPGEALRLRWVMQNVNGLMVVAGSEGPVGDERPHEHAVLAMTFATQSLRRPTDAR
jgi:hypothetical protein